MEASARAVGNQDPDGEFSGTATSSPNATVEAAGDVLSRDLPRSDWESRYRRRVIGWDLGVTLLCSALLAVVLVPRQGRVVAALLALGVFAATVVGLSSAKAWHVRVLGQGADEFHRLGRACATAAVIVGLVGLAFEIGGSRLAVFAAIPVSGLVMITCRYSLRRLLHRARAEGRCLLPVLVAGDPDTASDLIGRTRQEPHVGWQVEAVCTHDGRASRDPGDESTDIGGVPVVGGFASIVERVRRGGYRIVAVTADSYWTPQRLQHLAWDLEDTGAEMVVAPVLLDIGGPRLHVSGVLGMPLLRLSAPTFSGARRVIKGIVDRVTAASLLLLLAPLLAVLACSILAGDGRSPLFRQRRVGKHAEGFTMVKFRTMVPNAERKRAALQAANEGAGPLFKLRTDPRITRLGAVLRRYSLDELPQLWNVVRGDMSLVGPRPPLPAETESYRDHVGRRLLVKPGLTGLWQVSGRSDLSWEESVRLDLRYVEDWSLALDAVILWKTVRVVLRREGAY